MKIVIIVDGGLIQDVIVDGDSEVLVVDYDIDGVEDAEPSRLLSIPQRDGSVTTGIMRLEPAELNSKRVRELFDFYNKEA